MANYTIEIVRRAVNEGTLTFSGKTSFSCNCWWDPKDRVPAGTYSGCSATTMPQKKNSTGGPREGIYIPVPKRTGIFIHYWPGPGADVAKWSDGCTLVLESDMLRMCGDISPRNGRNVTVTIVDLSRSEKLSGEAIEASEPAVVTGAY